MKGKKRLVFSIITLLFCLATFVGTTFAWFTDSVSSTNNIIKAGNLDVEMYWSTSLSAEWKNVETDNSKIFDNDNWEPGYTEVRYIKIKNAGSLAFKYSIAVIPNGRVGKLADVIDVYYVTSPSADVTSRDLAGLSSVGKLKDVLGTHKGGGVLLPKHEVKAGYYSGEIIVAIALRMPTTAGNEYQGTAVSDSFDIQIVATQFGYESDSFGPDYDDAVQFPSFGDEKSASATVTPTADNKVPTGGVSLANTEAKISALVPEGVQLNDGATALTLTVNKLDQSSSNVILDEKEILLPLDVHIDGVSASNTVPMTVVLEEVAPKGLNVGNFKLYHVENGATSEMTAKATIADFANHNDFVYDPATGNITLYIASFSEVALVADTENKWNGTIATAFASGAGDEKDPYIIANADQLAYFGAVVGGMNDNSQNSFDGKFIKLIADVNLGDKENANEKLIFHPIGYYYTDDKNADGTTGDYYSTVYSFEGTFDGNGHTIANFYQNTWEIKGDYEGNYYSDAMGLFGYVSNGTIKNLTVDNFSSDGEFTPTGVISAYAVNSTFENIAITNCNPRVYNTGNGGIVGIGGNSDDPDTYKLTFTNITIDNTNKITALWGSWDVACGGLVGMFRGAGHVYMTNCNVAAQIDVYNDVCGNYQYYWYRYSGMMVGTNKNMITDANGYTVPETEKFHAENCTVHFGDWNNYYYCELVDNTLASYTHDHQFSRLTEVKEVDVEEKKVTLLDEDETVIDIPTSGRYNYVVVKGEHSTENATCYHFKDGAVWTHDMGGIQTGIDENGDGQDDLKEDKQHIFLPFNQLFTGYGWGVKHIPVYNGEDYAFDGIEILDRKVADSVVKFETKFTGDFLYRVGNQNTVALGSLFTAKDGVAINSSGVWATVEKVDENSNVSGTFTANTSDWTKGTIQFSGTGVVKVTIQDYNFCIPTILYLEVVDAKNAIGATSATENNVVLLNDCGFSSLEVSGGYTLYGNGFTMTCGSDSPVLNFGYSFVKLDNGTLDNVQIVCPNFDYAALYNSNLESSDNRSQTTDRTRYYNAMSGVMASGNSQILNSRISGGRAAVNVSGGNMVIDNSRIELGAVASLLVGAANSLTLRDTTLVQKPTASTYDSSKKLMGFSVLFVCDANGNAAPVTLEGTLVQNAWVDENDKQYVPSAGESIISTVLAKTEYLHDLDGDGTKESLNLGFAYMPESLASKVNASTITDNRTNKGTVPYDYAEVSILNGKTYVYSYKNTNGTEDSFKTELEYKPNKYSDIITVTYSDTTDGLTTGKSYGTDGWVYELNVDLDKASGYALDFSKLSISVNGVTVTDFKVNGSAKPTSPVAVTAGGTTYTLTATVDGKEYTATYKVTGSETSKESPSLVASNYEPGIVVASSLGGTWHGAAPALEGIKIKYWSVAEQQYKTITLSDYTPTTKGQLNGTNTTWTYSPDNGDFTLTLTGGQVHSSKNVYAMPVCVDKDDDGTADTLYFVAANSNGLVNTGNSARTITVSYSFKDNNNGDVLTFSNTWSVAEMENEETYNEQFSYSDLCKGDYESLGTPTKSSGSGGFPCVTPDTLITLADGTQKEIQYVNYSDEILVWDFVNGKYTKASASIVMNHGYGNYTVVTLKFDDGTVINTINGHGFFDTETNEYVVISEDNVANYVGHEFVKLDSNGYAYTKLVDYEISSQYTESWSVLTSVYYNCILEGMWTLTPAEVEDSPKYLMPFEINDDMKYDIEKMNADIETYGLYTYEEFADCLTEEQFNALGIATFKVAVAKGYITYEEIMYLINLHMN